MNHIGLATPTYLYLEDSARVSLELAARLPPAWDTPEHKARIYATFERLQIALHCAQHNAAQINSLMRSLRQLTEAAERRRPLEEVAA